VVKQDNHLSWTVNQTQTSYTLTWLSPGRTYSYYVYAVDRDLNVSPPSNTVTATTQPHVTAPEPPWPSTPGWAGPSPTGRSAA
jgi:hypothetical protein